MTNKGSITEEDISTLLPRYSATTVLSLLQEVANFPSPKIDWEALVKKSSTGITNAREYRMLWRHLAYRDSLIDKVEDGAQPLDDESDLESELEVVPAVDNEAAVEAAACVKVLMASGIPSESTFPNGSMVDPPLTMNIFNGQASRVLSESSQPVMHGTNMTVPISIQKQQLPNMPSADGSEAIGLASSSLANKRKRKPWSKAEDLELIAAVQKCGEGNWANILKGDFKGDRTASQLSQRWAIIRKRQGNANVKGSTSSSTQPTPALLAARHAMSLALAMPVKNLTSGAGGSTSSNALGNSLLSTTAAATGSSAVGSSTMQEQQQSQQVSIPAKSSIGESSCAMAKSRLPSKKSPPKANMIPDSMGLKAAAVAAGARIATPSDAASILMAAQAKNAVRVITTGASIVKGSVPGGTVHSGVHPNVHYIRTGLATQPVSSQSTIVSGASPSIPVKAIPQSTQRAPSAPGAASNSSSQQTDAVASTSSAEVQLEQEVKSEEETKFQKVNNMPKHTVQEDGSNQVKGHIGPSLRGETTDQKTVNNLNPLMDLQPAAKQQDIVSRDKVDNGQNANSDQIPCSSTREDENNTMAKEKCGHATVNKKESVLQSVVTDKESEIVKADVKRE